MVKAKHGALLVALAVSVTSCGGRADRHTTSHTVTRTVSPAARIVLVGDLMLGRHVADVVDNDPDSVFAGLRPVIVGADLALGNLESPFTTRAHLVGDNALEADPSSARLLAGAGFAGVGIANNHAGDAGPATVVDTLHALTAQGLVAIGAGVTKEAATRPLVFERNGVRIAVLAFDLTHQGPAPGAAAGVAWWDADRAHAAVDIARGIADVVVVGVHGGVEHLRRPDPVLAQVVDELTSWGVDVVWGTGAHVAYPVTIAASGSGGRTVQAPGLGNALFDQHAPGTQAGTVLEVEVDRDGVIAERTGRLGAYLRSTFEGWDAPTGDAVAVDGEWWTPVAALRASPRASAPIAPNDLPPDAILVAAASADIDGDGIVETVVSFRSPARQRLLARAFTGVPLVDAEGRSAHLGVYTPEGRLRWGAGTMPQPVAVLAACDAGVALAFSTLDDSSISSGGAWRWQGFGFATAPVLAGPATPMCIDLDGDGSTEPALARANGGTP